MLLWISTKGQLVGIRRQVGERGTSTQWTIALSLTIIAYSLEEKDGKVSLWLLVNEASGKKGEDPAKVRTTELRLPRTTTKINGISLEH